MTDLHDQLRAAAGAPPPTRIDLDALIGAEVRRRRTLRRAGAAATFAAVTALAIAVPLALGGGPASPGPDAAGGGPCPTVGAPGPQQSHAKPRPTERCADAVERLAAELSVAVEKVVPTMQSGPVEFVYVPVRLGYEATVTLTGPAGEDLLRVELIASHEHPDRTAAGCLDGCAYERDADDTIVVATQDQHQRQVSVFRPDGTAVLLLARPAFDASTARPASEAFAARPALTLDQVVAIARMPGLTLFPDAPPEAAAVQSPNPSATAPAPSVAPQDATAVRLSAALGERLAAALPRATLTDPNAPAGAPAPWFDGSGEGGYKAGIDIADAGGVSHLSVSLLTQRPPCTDPPNCETGPVCPTVDEDTRCDIAPDGTKVLVMTFRDGEFVTYQGELHRPDGSIVQYAMTNFGPDPAVDPTAYASGAVILCKEGNESGCTAEPSMIVTRETPALTNEQLVEIANALRL